VTPVDDIRRSWERRWAPRAAPRFDAARPSPTVRALQLFEPQVIQQALTAGPRLDDALESARLIQGLPTFRFPVPCRAVAPGSAAVNARWRRPRRAPRRPSHRRVIIQS
jgi:hypothetical protein